MEVTLTQILDEITRLQDERESHKEAIKKIDSTLESIRNRLNFTEDVIREDNETSFKGQEIRNPRFVNSLTRGS